MLRAAGLPLFAVPSTGYGSLCLTHQAIPCQHVGTRADTSCSNGPVPGSVSWRKLSAERCAGKRGKPPFTTIGDSLPDSCALKEASLPHPHRRIGTRSTAVDHVPKPFRVASDGLCTRLKRTAVELSVAASWPAANANTASGTSVPILNSASISRIRLSVATNYRLPVSIVTPSQGKAAWDPGASQAPVL